jgi:hypothetical protein
VQVVEMSLAQLVPYDRNPRRNESAVDAVAASIEQYGWQQPIVADEEGVILAGHTRYMAAEQLGLETVPVKVERDLTAEQKRAYRIADNRVADIAEWDEPLLAIEINDLLELSVESLPGFTDEEFREYAGRVNGAGWPVLPDGGDGTISQRAFVLHVEQLRIVEAALKKVGAVDSDLNTNRNSNALTAICQWYLDGG